MKPHTIHHGDCLEVMQEMEENSVDAVVCDPPYGLEFMGMKWDRLGNVGEGKSKAPTPSKSGQPFSERIGRVSYNASQNVRCRKCKHWKFSGTPCKCTSPDFPNIRSAQAQAMQGWHFAWACEALRVAKPGAYLLAFGGTRTFHRLACAIEDAGWTLRDTMMWVYGSGFPKSKSVALTIDKGEGHPNRGRAIPTASHLQNASDKHLEGNPVPDYEPKSEAAKPWNGFGTALKPSWEAIVLAQAPLEGTYAENILKWGCGALNIDGCRIAHKTVGSGNLAQNTHLRSSVKIGKSVNPSSFRHDKEYEWSMRSKGRWPANFLLSHSPECVEQKAYIGYLGEHPRLLLEREGCPPEDGLEKTTVWNCVPDCPVAILDGQSGAMGMHGAGGRRGGQGIKTGNNHSMFAGDHPGNSARYGDQGGASRFFYCAKASTQERNAGLEEELTLFEKRAGVEEKQYKINKPLRAVDSRGGETDEEIREKHKNHNPHPTVKPIALLRYLCRLVTPPGGLVLDPFAGSGSTGCAAVLEGFRFVGIEKEKEYTEIAEARIEHWAATA